MHLGSLLAKLRWTVAPCPGLPLGFCRVEDTTYQIRTDILKHDPRRLAEQGDNGLRPGHRIGIEARAATAVPVLHDSRVDQVHEPARDRLGSVEHVRHHAYRGGQRNAELPQGKRGPQRFRADDPQLAVRRPVNDPVVVQGLEETGVATADALKHGRHLGRLRIGVAGTQNGADSEQVKPLPLEILDGFRPIDVQLKIKCAAAKPHWPREQSPTLQSANITGRHSSFVRELFDRHPAARGVI